MNKLYLDITNKCNLKCAHCLNASSPENNLQLSLEIIIDIIKQIKPLKIKKIKLGGGEPLIHPQLDAILKLLYCNGYKISLTTNGLLINNSIINAFKKYDVSVSVSLETSKKTHEKIRGANTYFKTLTKIKMLSKNNVSFWIESMLFYNNLSEFEKHIKLVENLESKLKIRRIKNIGRATKEMVICETNNEYKNFIELINTTICQINIEHLSGIKKRPNIEIHETICGAGTESFHINYDGSINPCVFLGKNYISGNIYLDDLNKVLTFGKGFKIIEIINNSSSTGCPAVRKTCNTGLIDPLIKNR
jgi:radical SAM protein with 4Fe4S-binding SPASM domain